MNDVKKTSASTSPQREDGARAHAITIKNGKAMVRGTPHALSCAMVRLILTSPHQMAGAGVAVRLFGEAVRCDCGAIAHVPVGRA